MRFPILYSALLLSSFYANAQVTVKTGTSLVIENGTNFIASGDVTIEEGAAINNFGNLSFDRNFINRGNSLIDGNLIANGTVAQSIGGLDSFAINNLKLDNPASLALNSKISIINALELERGILYTDASHPVNFLSLAANPGETVDAYIDGTAIMQPRNTGTGAIQFLGCSLTAGADIGSITIVRTTGQEAVLNVNEGSSIAARWKIKVDTEPVAANRNISFSWLSPLDNEKNPGSIVLYGTSKLDSTKWLRLDIKSMNTVAGLNPGLRIYERKNIDFIGRTFTLGDNELPLQETPEQLKITTFPIPTTNQLNILLENLEPWAKDIVVKITDAYGKMYKEEVFVLNGNMITVNDLGVLPPGMYRMFISRGQVTSLINFVKY